MRGATFGAALMLASCARSGLELGGLGEDDPVVRGGSGFVADDGETGGAGQSGATGGALPTGGRVTGRVGGAGGSPTGGSGAAPSGGTGGSGGDVEPPLDPGGPIPDCGLDEPSFTPLDTNRWLYVESEKDGNNVARYLVELTPSGPQDLVRLTDFGEESTLGGWSADGRFFAITRTTASGASSVEVLDITQIGMPVPVAQRSGVVSWSPRGARYYLRVWPPTGSDTTLLTVVDVPTGAERVVEIRLGTSISWSTDGRYITLVNERVGVDVIDTEQEALSVHLVHNRGSEDPLWSPDGRYLAFVADGRLHLYDTVADNLVPLDSRASYDFGRGIRWYRNDWIAYATSNGDTFFLDVSVRPLVPVLLVDQPFPDDVSPGGKCVAYDGRCEATGQWGTCVRTLPPDPAKPSVQVGFSDEWTYWSASGEHLLIENAFDEPGTLTHVEVIGGAFARQPIGARDTTSQRPRWNASGRDDWIVFESDDSHAPRWHPHLWYRETRQTFSVDIGMGNYGLSKWSPGGRYLAIRSYDESAVDSEQVLYVQEVLDGELGNQWRVDDVTMPLDGGSWDFVWQP